MRLTSLIQLSDVDFHMLHISNHGLFGRLLQAAVAAGDTGWEAETETDSDDMSASETGTEDADEDDDEAAPGDRGEELPSGSGLRGASGAAATSSCGGPPRGGPPESFMDAYASVLEQQLQGTRMAESFVEAPAAPANPPAGRNRGGEVGGRGAPDDGLKPVDLDMNLVKSLLKSVAAQQVMMPRWFR